MLAIQKCTRETIVHQRTIEHCLTAFFDDSADTHYYWVNCATCCQNIGHVNFRSVKFYLTSCGCIYCTDCLEAVIRNCYIHGKITNIELLKLLPNSSQVVLENNELGQKHDNLFTNSKEKALDLQRAMEYANSNYDISVNRLDQLLKDSEQEKERLLAKLNVLEHDKEKLDLDIGRLHSANRFYEKDKKTEVKNCPKNELNSYHFKSPMKYKDSNNFAITRKTQPCQAPSFQYSKEYQERQNQEYQKISCNSKESQDSKLIKHFWNTVTDNPIDKSKVIKQDQMLQSSKQTVRSVPSTSDFQDFQTIRNSGSESRYDINQINYKSDKTNRESGSIPTEKRETTVDRYKKLLKPISKNYQVLSWNHKKEFSDNNKHHNFPDKLTYNPNKTNNDIQKRCNNDNAYIPIPCSEKIAGIDKKLDNKSYDNNSENTCIGNLQMLISKIKSEINQMQTSTVSNLKESQQNTYPGENIDESIKTPGNFATVWISENTDEVENLADSFDSDIFNLRTEPVIEVSKKKSRMEKGLESVNSEGKYWGEIRDRRRP